MGINQNIGKLKYNFYFLLYIFQTSYSELYSFYSYKSSLKSFFNVFIYFWDRERQSMSRGGAEREGDTESEAGFQAPSCQHRAWRGARTHEPWDHDLSRSRTISQLSPPGTPKNFFKKSTVMKTVWRWYEDGRRAMEQARCSPTASSACGHLGFPRAQGTDKVYGAMWAFHKWCWSSWASLREVLTVPCPKHNSW